jgi:chromate transporter
MKKKISLFKLYLIYIKIGALAFGGGTVLVPFLVEELGKKRNLLSEKSLVKAVAISQVIPGVFTISVATHTGYLLRGIKGAIVGCLGVATPSFILIGILHFFADSFMSNEYLAAFFQGVRIGVCALIIIASVKLFAKSGIRIIDFFILAISTVLSLIFGLNAVFIIITFILVGIALYMAESIGNVSKLS